MKRILSVIIASVALFFNSCEKERIRGNGSTITETRDLTGFTKVQTSGATPVYITYGPAFKVEVKGYANLLPYFETKIQGSELKLGYQNNVNVKNDNVEVYITMPAVESLKVAGSADINVTGNFSATTLYTEISGSGNIHIEEMDVTNFNALIGGSGSISALGVTSVNADTEIAGSGKITVSVSALLNARISGSGKIMYNGTPTVNATVSGNGSVIKL